jgi:hypothetical protein
MDDKQNSGDVIHAEISGPVSGQVGVGKGITQTQTTGDRPQVTEAELVELRKMFSDLKARIEVEAPPEKKNPALERAQELEEAVTAKEPDLTTMEYVKRWFVKNLPTVAGAVTGIVVNPIVGKVVEAAGEGLATQFRKRFGIEK